MVLCQITGINKTVSSYNLVVEEVGETCRAILKNEDHDAIDGIGDCVVVLTNLAELLGVSIEDCIEHAYHEIKDRTGKMDNGTFKKD